MKNAKVLLFLLVALAAMSCKPELQKRVEGVVAPYSGSQTCTTTDLVGQAGPTTLTDSALVYVTKPKDFENGFIAVLGQTTFLEENLEFTISSSNYYLSGKFVGPALTMSEDRIDQTAQKRIQCSYTLTKQ